MKVGFGGVWDLLVGIGVAIFFLNCRVLIIIIKVFFLISSFLKTE